ncbi:MAG: hypothetical protein M5U32_11000 [Myxococcota bacterium]|nr:hypothetical protein [Myxococcota bacterium]
MKHRDWTEPIRTGIALDVDRWGVPLVDAAAFLARIEASAALQALAQDGIDGQVRALLAAVALQDAILDPAGRAVEALANAPLEALRERLEAAGLEPELVAEALRRAARSESTPKRAGRKRSPRGDAVYRIDYALAHDAGLSARKRARLVASVVSDFFEPMTSEAVRLHLKDARARRRRAKLSSAEVVAAFLSCTESALRALGVARDRGPEERLAERHESGARGYMVRLNRE